MRMHTVLTTVVGPAVAVATLTLALMTAGRPTAGRAAEGEESAAPTAAPGFPAGSGARELPCENRDAERPFWGRTSVPAPVCGTERVGDG